MRTRRIGVVVPFLFEGIGGVPEVADFLVRTIERTSGFDYALVSLAMAATDADSVRLLEPRTWCTGVRVSDGSWRGRAFRHVGARWVEVEFQRYRPRRALARELSACDLIQVVGGSPAWALTVCGLGKPVAVQCATRARFERRRGEAIARGPKALWCRAMTHITDRLEQRALRRVDAVQVENPWMFDHVVTLNRGRNAIVRLAPPGIDITQFRPRDERERRAGPYILCVGRLDDPRKNIELLLQAYALLPRAVREATQLVLAGSAGPLPSFWRRAENIGLRERISFVTNLSREALVGLYQGASVFALPSDEEGLGLALLEAMACGVPAVSTRSGGPDGIIEDGRDGYLVPRDDAVALAERVTRLLCDPALSLAMGERARETLIRRYAVDVAGSAFVDVWTFCARLPPSTNSSESMVVLRARRFHESAQYG